MATWRPELHTMESVVSYYDEYDHPAYRVFAGNSPKIEYCRFQYDGTDKGIGREKLMEALQSLVQNIENTNTYIIQILKQKGKILEPYNQISFQLNKPNQMFPAQIGAFNIQPQNNQINNEILSRLRGLEEKLEMLEDEEEEEETEEKNVLTGLLNNPQMQSMLMGILANVLAPSKPQAVAGIKEVNATDDDQKIKVAIDILKANTENLGDKLIKLADMSVNNPEQYNMLVKML